MDISWGCIVAKTKREEVIMAHRKKTNGKGFALGAVIGGLVGGMTALLFTPKSGDKMRRDLAKKYHKTVDRMHDLKDSSVDGSSALYEKAKDVASDAKSHAAKLLKSRRR